jgi:hypothetical protein
MKDTATTRAFKAVPSSKTEWRFQINSSFVRDPSLSIEARLLYVIIQSHVGPNCVNPYPSLMKLARAMNRHRGSIQKYLKELEAGGWIERIKIKADGKFTSTRYVLNSRSQDSPLRDLPTTGAPTSKSNQFKDLPFKKDLPSKEAPLTPGGGMGFPSGFSEERKETFTLWAEYKKEKGQAYKPIGWKAFLSGFDHLDDSKINAAIQYAMARNYDGIVDSKNQDQVQAATPKPKRKPNLPSNWQEIASDYFERPIECDFDDLSGDDQFALQHHIQYMEEADT